MTDHPSLPLGVALRRSLIRVAASGGAPTRAPENHWLDADHLRSALFVVDRPADFDPDMRLAAWAALKAFRGEYTDVGRARALAGLPSGLPSAPGAAHAENMGACR